jgi:hypothetical protein
MVFLNPFRKHHIQCGQAESILVTEHIHYKLPTERVGALVTHPTRIQDTYLFWILAKNRGFPGFRSPSMRIPHCSFKYATSPSFHVPCDSPLLQSSFQHSRQRILAADTWWCARAFVWGEVSEANQWLGYLRLDKIRVKASYNWIRHVCNGLTTSC